MMGAKWLSPDAIRHIDPALLPSVIETDNLFSRFGWLSRKHTHGYYGHSMWCHRPGFVASQGLFYKERPIDDWLDGRYRVKVWRNPDWTEDQKAIIRTSIETRLALPRHRRAYDPVAVLGQGLGLRWLQILWLDDCSESVGEDLEKVERHFRIPNPNPSDINEWFKRHYPDGLVGIYDPDLE